MSDINQSNHSNAALYLETLSALADERLAKEESAEFKIPSKYLDVSGYSALAVPATCPRSLSFRNTSQPGLLR